MAERLGIPRQQYSCVLDMPYDEYVLWAAYFNNRQSLLSG